MLKHIQITIEVEFPPNNLDITIPYSQEEIFTGSVKNITNIRYIMVIIAIFSAIQRRSLFLYNNTPNDCAINTTTILAIFPF